MRGPVVDDKIQRNYITLTNHYSTIHLPFTTYILDSLLYLIIY